MKLFLNLTVIVFALVYSGSVMAYSYFYALAQQNGTLTLAETSSTRASTEAPVVWTGNALNITLDFDTNDAPFIEGVSWNEVAYQATVQWNNIADSLSWTASYSNNLLDACSDQYQSNNSIAAWGYTYCGNPWGDDVLALTQITYQISQTNDEVSAAIVGASIVVNNTKNWRVYRGPVQYLPDGTPINDFQRVILHELGHVAGLTHPDENGQQVHALMNSRESSLDSISADDISGINALYPMLIQDAVVQRPAKGGGAIDGIALIALLLSYRFRLSRIT